jgi:hypothetical protein
MLYRSMRPVCFPLRGIFRGRWTGSGKIEMVELERTKVKFLLRHRRLIKKETTPSFKKTFQPEVIIMKTSIVGIALLFLLAALIFPFLLHVAGAIAGLAFGIAVTLGVLVFAGFVIVAVLSGAGILVGGILGIVGVALLFLGLPIFAPLFIVLLPVILLVWLVFKLAS